jgi:orotate phosphoribosyltransferase
MIKDETALKLAELLLQIKAIKLAQTDKKEVFTWASGWKSPIYCDNRITLSYPKIRTYIRQKLVECIEINFGVPDVIAGVATGAIAHGVLVAESLGLPFIYVRSQEKGHGLGNQIEGELKKGQKVIVIEDLISTGQSSLKVVNTLKNQGAAVSGMISIFNYGFNEAAESFKNEAVKVVSLCGYDALLEQALISGYINEKELDTLKSWRLDPAMWRI